RRQDLADLRDDGRVRAPLWLAYDEHSVEELQALSHEDTEIDETLVLRAPPASRDRFLLEPRAHDLKLPRGRQSSMSASRYADDARLVREVGEERGAQVALAE